MRLKSLTYISEARPGLSTDDICAIHRIARELNALDGITGLLIFNGRNFLQLIEGAESAIDDLLRRLLADPRHSGLTIEDKRFIDRREFPDWAMELAQVSIDYLPARTDIAAHLPPSLPDHVRARIVELGESPLG